MRSTKPLNYPFFAKLIVLFAVMLLPKLLIAQTDREFWFVAPNVYQDSERDFNKPIVLRLTSLTSPATVTISMPADPSFTPIVRSVGANSTVSVDLSAWINQLQNKPANATLNKGLLITATADITAYYEVVSGCDCNPEIFSLKGKNALGNEFFISSQLTFAESTSYAATNAFDIVATKDNTHVTITPTRDIVGHAANVPFTITLNKGQTYSAQATGPYSNDHLQGSYVSSDNPIAVTLKDDLVQISSCADLIGDQTVPVSVLGTQYVVTKGYLSPNGDSQIFDYIYVTATENNTSVYLNGNSSPAATLQRGETVSFNLFDVSTYISSDKKIYVYHLTGNGCEAGSAVIPKLNCTGSRSVSLVRSKTNLFAVMITTKNGNQNSFTVNGNSGIINGSSFTPVPGTGGEYVTARIDLSSNVSVGAPTNFANSSGNFSLGFINGGTSNGTAYGYFSDYKSSNVEKSSFEICPFGTAQLSAYGGVTYQWTPAAGLDNPNIANPKASPAATTDYTVKIISADGCVDEAKVHVAVSNSGVSTPASVAIAATSSNICAGTNVTFTATPTNGGTAPSYQWEVNGVIAALNSGPTFASNTLVNGDKVTCIMTSNAPCATPTVSTSNTITMAVSSDVGTINITVSKNDVCAGEVVTFTAIVTGGGDTPVYKWELNNIEVANTPTYTTNSFIDGDMMVCKLLSSAQCASTIPVESNPIIMRVNSASPAMVSITASNNNVCAGTPITFTATPTNGGTAPVYQWRINGVNAGTNSNTFSSSTLANGDQISCMLTSNSECATDPYATSNTITVGIIPNVPVGVSITSSANNVCAGTLIDFTAVPVNGGSAPIYQWQVNSLNVGTNSPAYSSNALVSGDNVTCVITSNAPCATPATASSNIITMQFNPQLQPSVNIIPSANNVCAGTMVNFTAMPTNGGTNPIYQWQVNGTNAGTNSNIFSSSTLVNGDRVTCTITSNALCAAPTTAGSNEVNMIVNSDVVAVSITPSQNNICPGSSVTFTAMVTGGGTAPVYQWKVNGINAGSNSFTFMSTTFVNGDKVTCTVTSNAPCAAIPTANSNEVTINTIAYVTPTVTIVRLTGEICLGDAIDFSATAVNAGANPIYRWQLNGNDVGQNSPTLTIGPLRNNDVIQCIVVSNGTCTLNPVAFSNPITVSVNEPVTPSVTITESDNNICVGTMVSFSANIQNGGSNPSYQWTVNGNAVGSNSAVFQSSTLANGDVVTCRLNNPDHCVLPSFVDSNPIGMVINPLPVVNAGNTQTMERGASVRLNGAATGSIGDITWSPSTGLSNTKVLDPIASPSSTTTYRLTITSVSGCINYADVKVTVLISLVIPNSFSPNGDGVNDRWVIKNFSDYPDASVEVFSRWGQSVYRSAQSNSAWDGTFNGKQLPAGVYYYIIRLDRNSQPTSGNITLIR